MEQQIPGKSNPATSAELNSGNEENPPPKVACINSQRSAMSQPSEDCKEEEILENFDSDESIVISKLTLDNQQPNLTERHNSIASTDVVDYRSSLFDDHKVHTTEVRDDLLRKLQNQITQQKSLARSHQTALYRNFQIRDIRGSLSILNHD